MNEQDHTGHASWRAIRFRRIFVLLYRITATSTTCIPSASLLMKVSFRCRTSTSSSEIARQRQCPC